MSVLDTLDKKMPILVVDDFSTMRRIVKNCLKQLGFENVTEAEDGQVAWGKVQAGSGDDRYKTLPFLMVTAEAQKKNVIEAAKAGVSNYIIKPFTADMLQTKLEAIFNRK